MKRLISTLCCMLLVIAAFAQSANGHLKYMGIPITGTITQFQNKLAAKGIKYNQPMSARLDAGTRGFNGTFAGNKVTIFVYYDIRSKIVYRVKSVIEDRRDVLAESEHVHREVDRCDRKEDKRDGGDDAGAGETERKLGIDRRQEVIFTDRRKPEDITQSNGHHHEGFKQNAHPGVEHELFLKRPVNSPGRRDAERNPGKVAEGDDHDEHAGHGEHHARSLRAREAFTEKEDAAGNGDERREEGADAELHDVTAQNGDHVDPPVEAGEARGGREQKGGDWRGEN